MAAPPPFKVLQTQDQNLTLIQSNIKNSLDALVNSPLMTGTSVAFDSTSLAPNIDVILNHGLGTNKVAWLPGSQSTPGSIYLSPNNSSTAKNPSPNNSIILRSTVPMSAVLWFYQTNSPPSASVNNDVTVPGDITVDNLTVTGTSTLNTVDVSGPLTATDGVTTNTLVVTTSVSGAAFDSFEGCSVVNFTYQTHSPMVLQPVLKGCVIDRVLAYISTPFNDSSATLQLGTTGDINLVLNSADSDPTIAGQYSNQAFTVVPINDLFLFTITPGASTQGAGTLFFRASLGPPGV